MGMFDSLYVDCCCGNKVEFQSNAGDCTCESYQINNVLNSIAGYLIGSTEKCDVCGAIITLRGSVVLVAEFTHNAAHEPTATKTKNKRRRVSE